MLFTVPAFLFLFLPLLLGLYFLTPERWRNPLLIVVSLLFYAFGEKSYVGILLFSIALNYVGGLMVGRFEGARSRRLALAAGVASNLLLLIIFKYADFLIINLDRVLALLALPQVGLPAMHLPVGISFFTFMGISYLVDIYRRQLKAQTSLSNFSLYLTLFPHLVAGPIVRYGDIAAEIIARKTTRSQFVEGIKRFTFGFGKKMIIANALALPADRIFSLPTESLTPGIAWLGALCYTLQIYYDFSGYTDMAIGMARLFGFHFPENFNYPYISTSNTEFWRRWHISLSTWFRDYLFFPLGVRRPPWRLYLNLWIVFFLCGLWHGARWNFVVWGLFHGTFLVLERVGLLKLLARVPRPLRHVYAMLVVMVGWVFFRAESLPQAVNYLGAMVGLYGGTAQVFRAGFLLDAQLLLVLAAGLIGSAPVVPLIAVWQERAMKSLKGDGARLFEVGAGLARVAAVVFIFITAATFSAAGTYNPFIYFRF